MWLSTTFTWQKLTGVVQAAIPPINRLLPHDPPRVEKLDTIPAHLSAAVDGLIDHLDHSVMLRVRNIPKRK